MIATEKPPTTASGAQRWVLLLGVSLALLAVLTLVQTNSRTSILVKEAAYVAGSLLLVLGLMGAGLAGRLRTASRLGPVQLLLLLAILLFGPAHMLMGSGSVSTPYSVASLLALALVAAGLALLGDRWTRDRLVLVLLAAGGLVCLYALLQWTGVELFAWDRSLARSGRVSGSLGNPNLMGSLAAALPPVMVGYLLYRKTPAVVFIPLAAAAVVVCGLTIVASATRGSLLGLGAGMLVLLVLSARRIGRKLTIVITLLLLLGLLVALLPMRGRLEELRQGQGGTLTVRRVIWSGAFRAFLDRPLVGWGPGSFQKVFPAYRNPDYHLMGVSHNTLHAHCEYLELLLDGGLVLFLLWTALGVSTWIRRRRQGGFDALSAGVLAAMAALLAEALVSVALRWPPSAMLLAALTGLLLIPGRGSVSAWKPVPRPASALLLLPAAGLALALPLYFQGMHSGQLLFAGKDRHLTRSEPSMNQAYNLAARWAASGDPALAQNALRAWDTACAHADSAVQLCQRCVEVNPRDLGGWYALGSSYLTRAILAEPTSGALRELLQRRQGWSSDSLEEARMTESALGAYRELMDRAPYYAEVLNNMALVYTRMDNLDSAMVYMWKAYRLHAHRRIDYYLQIESLGPILESDYAWRIATAQSAQARIGKIGRDPVRTEALFRSLFRSSAALLQRYPERGEELALQTAEVLEESGLDLPVDDLETLLLDLAGRERLAMRLDRLLQEGDTAGVLGSLDSLPPISYRGFGLPLIQARSEGSEEGQLALSLEEHLRFLARGLRAHLGRLPMGIDQLFELRRAAMAGTHRNGWWEPMRFGALFLLYSDMELANLCQLAESEFPASTSDSVAALLRTRWEELGGPRYCAGSGMGDMPWACDGLLGRLVADLDSLAALPQGSGVSTEEVHVARIELAYGVLTTQMWSGAYMRQAQLDSVLSWVQPSLSWLGDSLGPERCRNRVSRSIRLIDENIDGLLLVANPAGIEELTAWFRECAGRS